ncbi:hypothetical protein [Thiorhodovibrio frisius]|uniref:Uncharacterized protein n=1 Tax=Thiorhodovibrio frisius TaxID=631362 RepID=H8YYE0_9GAMM|nr:hypothetical protein [Thiorhodovibrio frisius]EIC23466.1 hypothetical protein Thi970DRAFT_01136 [Thiorhodovibrio frisius]WPL23449.1 hypothetical protein Thiofri_03634 [Thiorhodovibrio frisius]
MVIDEAIRNDPEAILKRFDSEDRRRGLGANVVDLSAIALILLKLSPRFPIFNQWSTTNEAPHTN